MKSSAAVKPIPGATTKDMKHHVKGCLEDKNTMYLCLVWPSEMIAWTTKERVWTVYWNINVMWKKHVLSATQTFL